MTRPHDALDALISSLREDLPTLDDDERVRARLASAGLVVSAGVSAAPLATASAATATTTHAAPLGTAAALGSTVGVAELGGLQAGAGAAAAAKATSGLALVSKLSALSAGSKLVIAASVVGIGAYPALSDSFGEPAPAATSIAAPQSQALPAERATQSRVRQHTDAREVTPAPGSVAATDTSVEKAEAFVPKAATRGELAVGSAVGVVQEPSGGGADAARPLLPSGKAPAEAVAPVDSTTTAVSSFPSVEQSRLQEEARLIERALRARKAGSDAEARHWLLLHQQRFPSGALAPERERALRGLGR